MPDGRAAARAVMLLTLRVAVRVGDVLQARLAQAHDDAVAARHCRRH